MVASTSIPSAPWVKVTVPAVLLPAVGVITATATWPTCAAAISISAAACLRACSASSCACWRIAVFDCDSQPTVKPISSANMKLYCQRMIITILPFEVFVDTASLGDLITSSNLSNFSSIPATMPGMRLSSLLLLVSIAWGGWLASKPPEEPAGRSHRSDEPPIEQFSLQRAVSFADASALQWEQQRDCVTCHTNGLYLVAAARVAPTSSENRRAREFALGYLNRYVVEKKQPSGQRGAVEGLVATTCFLAISDMGSVGKLSPDTRKALDHMWSLQDEDGAWSAWLKCGWPPFEADDHFGVTLAAVTAGVLPQSYRGTAAAAAGIERLRGWLRDHPPQNLHHKGMMLWAASGLDGVLDGLVDDETRKKWSRELLAGQRPDGGWRLVDVGAGKWKRPEDVADKLPSDAYATAFSIFVLRQAEIPVDHPQLQRGLEWLRQSQRESGRWFVRSPKRDGKHYISHAATMFAILAFDSCGEES